MKAHNFITNFTAPFGKNDTYYMSTYHSKPLLSNGIGPISMQSICFEQSQILKYSFCFKSPGTYTIYAHIEIDYEGKIILLN